MGCQILTTGLIPNQNGPTQNPWECHYFTHQVETIEDEYFKEHIEWGLDGDIPLDIEIDKDIGLIHGVIKPLTVEQPGIDESMFTPDEVLKEDGSNWKNIGRYKNTTYTFKFRLYRIYRDESVNGPISCETENCSIIESGETIDGKFYAIKVQWTFIEIMVIKNNDIDNYIFAKKYFDAGYKIVYNDISYTKENEDDFFKNHPGPFGNNC